MASNVEIKVKIKDILELRKKIESFYSIDPIQLFQEDTFFNICEGRLKLRIYSTSSGELIYYKRQNSKRPKRSDYFIYKTNEPEKLRHVLEYSLGIRGVIKKKRLLYLIDNKRIHLDEVEQLGAFLELEVVLKSEQDENEGKQIVNDFMKIININEKDLIDKAYIDLLEECD